MAQADVSKVTAYQEGQPHEDDAAVVTKLVVYVEYDELASVTPPASTSRESWARFWPIMIRET